MNHRVRVMMVLFLGDFHQPRDVLISQFGGQRDTRNENLELAALFYHGSSISPEINDVFHKFARAKAILLLCIIS